MVHARYPPPTGDYGYDPSFAYDEVVPGERVGPPLARTRGRRIVRGGVLLLVTLGGGWFLLQHQEDVPRWTSAVADAVSQLTAAAAPAESIASAPPRTDRRLPDPPFVPTSAPMAPPLEERPMFVAPPDAPPLSREASAPAADETPKPPVTTASLPPHAVASEDPGSAAISARANPADPLQVRAEAAGLHPGLSRVLLESLTPADFRNAGHAVRTALAQTPDSAVFVWPRQQAPGHAVFKVRFVAGADAGCRRYVVTVIKDRWATTARPMEKCGVPQPGQSRLTSHRPRP